MKFIKTLTITSKLCFFLLLNVVVSFTSTLKKYNFSESYPTTGWQQRIIITEFITGHHLLPQHSTHVQVSYKLSNFTTVPVCGSASVSLKYTFDCWIYLPPIWLCVMPKQPNTYKFYWICLDCEAGARTRARTGRAGEGGGKRKREREIERVLYPHPPELCGISCCTQEVTTALQWSGIQVAPGPV